MGRLRSFLILSIIALASSSSIVVAEEEPDLVPPKRFDHPFNGKLVEHSGNLRQVQMWCATIYGEPFPYLVEGCALPMGKRCEIVYTRKKVRRHEIAHCNGWPPHHPK
jgi:hypothetical protein